MPLVGGIHFVQSPKEIPQKPTARIKRWKKEAAGKPPPPPYPPFNTSKWARSREKGGGGGISDQRSEHRKKFYLFEKNPFRLSLSRGRSQKRAPSLAPFPLYSFELKKRLRDRLSLPSVRSWKSFSRKPLVSSLLSLSLVHNLLHSFRRRPRAGGSRL